MEARGITSSDIVVRYAIKAGLAELRRETWLLDYVAPNLLDDELTADLYGAADVARMKEWFLATEIRVVKLPPFTAGTLPMVSVKWVSGGEEEDTLADLNPQTTQDDLSTRPTLVGPLDPASWSPLTGQLLLPASVTQIVTTNMVVTDRGGADHPVLDVSFPAAGGQLLTLAPGTSADFRGLRVRDGRPGQAVQLEGSTFRESFQLGVHVAGEAVHLSYLHAILLFVLLRGRQDLLEARGFERSQIQYGGEDANEAFEGTEKVWSRYTTLTGMVRQVWPKKRSGRIADAAGAFGMEAPGQQSSTKVGGGAPDESWLAQDPLSTTLV